MSRTNIETAWQLWTKAKLSIFKLVSTTGGVQASDMKYRTWFFLQTFETFEKCIVINIVGSAHVFSSLESREWQGEQQERWWIVEERPERKDELWRHNKDVRCWNSAGSDEESLGRLSGWRGIRPADRTRRKPPAERNPEARLLHPVESVRLGFGYIFPS